MKKIFLLFFTFYLSLFTVSAQYTVLHNFNDTAGGIPYGNVILVGKNLYGMASSGSGGCFGVVFSVDTNGNNYRVLVNFNGSNGDGPHGSLVAGGNKLFGMTRGGATYGNIFSVDTDGTHFKQILGFNDSNGGFPWTNSLILSGKKLFGMTLYGGRGDSGVIFAIDTDGSHYKKLYNFGNASGYRPWGSLTLLRHKLYGMAQLGGAHNQGVLFSIDSNGSNYKVMYSFVGQMGGYACSDLCLYKDKFYGMTEYGGPSTYGNIFRIDTNGTGFDSIFNFSPITNGQSPYGALIAAGNKLWGMTWEAGTCNLGLIFSIDTNGAAFTNAFGFCSSEGGNPYGTLTASGDKVYGMASYEGLYSFYGVVFKFKDTSLITGNNNLPLNKPNATLFPNPNHGKFTIVIANEAKQSQSHVEIYNMLGEKVYSQISLPNTQYSLDLSNQSPGIYMYRIISEDGNQIATGKFIIE
jgi:uncharacterized repeat protein (TIGR03803 family)